MMYRLNAHVCFSDSIEHIENVREEISELVRQLDDDSLNYGWLKIKLIDVERTSQNLTLF